MSQPFNADEIFEIAEQIERNGARFYRRAAEFAIDPKARDLLTGLAEMEDQHERTFAAMREEARKEHPDWCANFWSDGQNEAVLYLRAIAEGKVFDLKTDPAAALSGNETLPGILKTAIGLEKDSIVFYLGIKDAVPQNLGRDKIGHIIREEMTHITTLTSELDAAEKGGDAARGS